jgi:sulfide dehydrogenase [flavocytochrome c] flavoprotein subunit
MHPTRRALFAAPLLAAPFVARAQNAPRLVIIGGGFGGASAARFARDHHPDVQVTLVEPRQTFVTCPYGNLVLGGVRTIDQISFGYTRHAARGVRVVHESATAIDPAARSVRLSGGSSLGYDKLILSPGISIRWGALEGYDEPASAVAPHAWVPGDGSQTLLLRRQLEAMPDGGVVGLAIPANPFRCPPGPYERISMIAAYLKREKPRSKILALDAKEAFSKQGLFTDAWAALYPGMIEWVPSNRDGKVVRVDARERVMESEFGVKHKVDVLNVIPPQAAGSIAAPFADQSGWVQVNPRTFEARTAPHIHVIGDANTAPPMPKSGFIANSTARQAVASAVALAKGAEPPASASYFNTCYSHVGEGYGISVVGIFRPNEAGTGFVETPNSGGVSPRGDLPDQRRLEAAYADSWYRSITDNMFG